MEAWPNGLGTILCRCGINGSTSLESSSSILDNGSIRWDMRVRFASLLPSFRSYGLDIRSDVPGTPNPKMLVQLQQTVYFQLDRAEPSSRLMPEDFILSPRYPQRRIWIGKGSVRWFNFNGASHKSSALAFEANGDGALPSAPTKGPGISGAWYFQDITMCTTHETPRSTDDRSRFSASSR